MELCSSDVFMTIKNAQDAGVFEMIPSLKGEQGLGKRFFESLQRNLIEKIDLEKLDMCLFYLAPTLHFMANPKHWEPKEFTSNDFFIAVKNLQTMGAFEISKVKLKIPGAGDRFFEYYQRALIEKIGPENMDRLLFVLGQCICFLASEEAMENMKGEKMA